MNEARERIVTLIVARKIEAEIRIISDSKITNYEALLRSQLQGVLKCIIVSPTCCVSYAGEVWHAEQALTAVLENPQWSREKVIDYLLGKHIELACKADFLVAFSDGTAIIDRIANGILETDLPSAWIGDQTAFSAFQAHFHAKAPPPQNTVHWGASLESELVQIAERMSNAFNAVVGDSRYPSVDGFAIRVTSQPAKNDGFRYLSHMSGTGFLPVSNTTEPTSLLRTLGAEGGSFSYSILVPSSSGVGAIGIYVLEGCFGVLFFPARQLQWIKETFRDVTCDEFISAVRQKHGIAMDGFGWS